MIEQDAGGAGKALTDRYTRHLLRGYNARADRVQRNLAEQMLNNPTRP